jgi:hypothetical protein
MLERLADDTFEAEITPEEQRALTDPDGHADAALWSYPPSGWRGFTSTEDRSRCGCARSAMS